MSERARDVLVIDSRVVGKWWQHMKPSPFDHLQTMGERHLNRRRTQRPNRDKFWCNRCDRQLVGEWRKCPGCGYRNGRRREKR